VGGVIKYFRFSYDEVLWTVSYVNINMFLATIPTYEKEDNAQEKAVIDQLANAAPGKKEVNDFFKKTRLNNGS
jgi:hypothetical protein